MRPEEDLPWLCRVVIPCHTRCLVGRPVPARSSLFGPLGAYKWAPSSGSTNFVTFSLTYGAKISLNAANLHLKCDHAMASAVGTEPGSPL